MHWRVRAAPWELVEGLVDDLYAFCNDDSLPAIAHAANAHAQFETIHPFGDGNGRTGRALVHMVMRRRGLAPRVQPPISLVLATISAAYIEALGAYRYTGDSDSAEVVEGVNRWVALFAGACVRAVEDAEGLEGRMHEIEAGWRARLVSVRRGSSVDLLLGLLPGAVRLSLSGARLRCLGARLLQSSTLLMFLWTRASYAKSTWDEGIGLLSLSK